MTYHDMRVLARSIRSVLKEMRREMRWEIEYPQTLGEAEAYSVAAYDKLNETIEDLTMFCVYSQDATNAALKAEAIDQLMDDYYNPMRMNG